MTSDRFRTLSNQSETQARKGQMARALVESEEERCSCMDAVMHSANVRTKPRPAAEPVEYILSSGSVDRHRLGINAVVVDRDACSSTNEAVFYSAGRDAVVRSWKDVSSSENENSEEPKLLHSFRGHTNWINDICVINSTTIASGSSDSTVVLWDSTKGAKRYTFKYHRDYVKCLSWNSQREVLLSGGFDSRICVWDVGSCVDVGSISPSRLHGQHDSVYSLATAMRAPIVVAGSPSMAVRGWDLRTLESCFCLRGHTDNVRALLLDVDGQKCISGSSDGTVRHWDTRMMRCLSVLRPHECALFSLRFVSPSSGRYILSSDSCGCLMCTDVETRSSSVVLKHRSPILGFSVVPLQNVKLMNNRDVFTDPLSLWICTTQNCLEKYEIGKDISNCVSSGSPLESSAMAACKGDGHATLKSSIPGVAAIQRHKILNNRRFVITQDDSSRCLVWDVTTGLVVKDYGNLSFDELETRLAEVEHVPSWFSVDSKIGLLTIRLHPANVFAADHYAIDAGFSSIKNSALKVNIGESVLLGLFRDWLKSRAAIHSDLPGSGSGQELLSPVDGFPISPRTELEHRLAYDLPSETLCFVGTTVSTIGDCGSVDPEIEGIVPNWVKEVLLRGVSVAVVKLRFYLLPLNPPENGAAPIGSEIDYLPHGEGAERGKGALNGLPLTRMWKLCKYITDGCQIPLPEGVMSHELIELRCSDRVLDPDWTMRTVKTFVWRRSEDLILHYSYRNKTTGDESEKKLRPKKKGLFKK